MSVIPTIKDYILVKRMCSRLTKDADVFREDKRALMEQNAALGEDKRALMEQNAALGEMEDKMMKEKRVAMEEFAKESASLANTFTALTMEYTSATNNLVNENADLRSRLAIIDLGV